MGENYDALSNALNNLDNTVMNIHEEVLVQNALIDNTADDVEQSKNVMDALTKKAQEYLGTSDNCQTCSATGINQIRRPIMVISRRSAVGRQSAVGGEVWTMDLR